MRSSPTERLCESCRHLPGTPGAFGLGWRWLVLLLAFGLILSPALAQTLLFNTSSANVTDNTIGHVTSSGVAPGITFTGPGLSGAVGRCTALALDPALQTVFFLDATNRAIWSINVNGSGLALVKSNLTATPVDLALDTAGQKIYFCTSSATQTNNTLQRIDYSGNNNQVLFTATGAVGNPVGRCTALALDLAHGVLCFSDTGAKALWQTALNGTGLTLVSSNLTAAPLDLALDPANQLIYYVTSDANQASNTVQRISYAGTGNTRLFTATGAGNGVFRCTALTLDLPGSRIFLSDAATLSLWSLTLDGSDLRLALSGLPAVARRLESIPLLSHVTVVNLNDSGPGSLREAFSLIGFSGLIDFANPLVATNSGTIYLSTADDNTFGPSALVVSNQITVVGPTGTNGIIIARSNGAPALRLFFVSPQGVLSLRNLTLTNGLAQGGDGGSGWQRGGGGGGGGGIGGAIFNWGTLDLANSTLAGNQARGGEGGGIYGNGSGSGGGGGGMAGDGGIGGSSDTGANGGAPQGGNGGTGSGSGASGGIGGGGGGGGSSSTAGNGSGPGGMGGFGGGGGGGGAYQTAGFGGGIGGAGGWGGFGGGGGGPGSGTPGGAYGQPGFGGGGSSRADDSGNVGSVGGGGAGLGGAVFNVFGRITITNCTFSANVAAGGLGGDRFSDRGTNGQGLGGAIFTVNASVNTDNSTFAYNQAEAGAAIYNLGFGGIGTTFTRNSILARSPAGVSDFAAATSGFGITTNLGSYNLIQTNTGFGGGILTSADPRLGPLARNGGPTLTHALLYGSPAINAGDNTDLPPTDQRGYARIADALGSGPLAVDLGAVEAGLLRLRTVPQTRQNILLNGFELFLTAESNRLYVIQASTNLQNWSDLSTNLVPATELTIFDHSAGALPPRFYRARTLP